MAQAKTTSKTTTTTTKQGQQAKQPAPAVAIRPTAPKGWTQAGATSAVKADAKPSEYYPQGGATIKLLDKGARMGADQQRNWDAIHAALGGKAQGALDKALAKDNTAACTRRHVRRLARAGYLVWQPAKA